jgi:hypothetical protein
MSSRSSSLVLGHASKLLAGVAAALGLASGLAGCPIYSADSCAQDPSCTEAQPVPVADAGYDQGSGCNCAAGYTCSTISGAPQCVAYDCRASELACGTGQTCKDNGAGAYVCASTVNDCRATGCIAGYACTNGSSGVFSCTSTNPNACVADADCATKTGAGSLCLGGVCTAPKDLCTDSTQCKGSASCVNGRCTPKCAATCATGYSCDANTGLCSAGTGACGDGTTCSTSQSCVNTRCVQACATDGSCAAGTVCVAGGCVVDDRPTFFCDQAGTADGTQDKCSVGSVCLHHNCYVSCESDASCATVDQFNVCKTVTTSSGSHQVCGSTTNLGSQCDPTTTPPKTCAASQLCIDGFCK